MGQNDQKIILYDISFNLEGERVLVHPLLSHFLKEGLCFDCGCVGYLGYFGPKGALGSQKHVEEVSGVCEEN